MNYLNDVLTKNLYSIFHNCLVKLMHNVQYRERCCKFLRASTAKQYLYIKLNNSVLLGELKTKKKRSFLNVFKRILKWFYGNMGLSYDVDCSNKRKVGYLRSVQREKLCLTIFEEKRTNQIKVSCINELYINTYNTL